MALSGRTQKPPVQSKPGPKCGVGKLKDTLAANGQTGESDGLVELVEAVRASRAIAPFSSATWTAVAVHQILLEEGHAISLLTVQRHISKKCACGW